VTMNDKVVAQTVEFLLLAMLVSFMFYGLYQAGNDRSFDHACFDACAPARSITPIIDFKNQCLCDEGHGKWKYQDVKSLD